MWVWRAFIFSLSIALLAAIASPARATQTPNELTASGLYSATLAYHAVSDCVVVNAHLPSTELSPVLPPNFALLEYDSAANKKRDAHPDNKKSANDFPNKAPVYQVKFAHNVSLPPSGRQAASAFGSVLQNEPTFVLAYEFLPEIVEIKHFLAPLSTNSAIPWYLRPDASTSHSRLTGWKDGNTLYTGSLTYLI